MARTPEMKSEVAARILDAADEVVGEVGYAAMSMRDVAVQAGVNKALVFYYFSSKEDLFERVLERYYTAHLQALKEAFGGGGTLAERFHRVVDAYLDFIERNLRYPRIVQGEIAGAGPHRQLVARNLAPLFDWVHQTLADLAPQDGPLAARHFFLTISGAVINYFTYSPLLEDRWGGPPLERPALDERRAHIHWLVDTLVGALQNARQPPSDQAHAQGVQK